MLLKLAQKEDLEQVVNLRLELLQEEGAFPQVDIRQKTLEYFQNAINTSMLVAIAEENNQLIATSSVIFQMYPPSYGNPEGLRAYVTNVYTKPSYRRQGISSKLLDLLIEEVKKKGIHYIWLWATPQGKPMYQKYGFNDLTLFSTMEFSIPN